MPYAIRAEVEGLKEMLAAIAHLKQAARSRILRSAVSKGARIILKAAKRFAPKESGLLRKSLGVKVQVYRSTGKVVGIVGPRDDAKFRQRVTRRRGKWFPSEVYSRPAKYAHLVELGHAGRAPAPPRPFLRPALATSQPQVKEAFARAIREGLEREAAKLLRKGKA